MAKKKLPGILLICLLALMALSLAPAPAWAAGDIRMLVNGEALQLDVPPLVEDGRTLVPVRAIAESLGAYVSWNQETRRVEIELEERRIALIIDNTIAYVDGVPKQLDVPARIVEGRTLVPARFISESLHGEVNWDGATRVVSILTYENVAAYSATFAQLEQDVLAELNERRAKLGRTPLLSIEELAQMARSQAAELAKSGSFSHISARFGDTASRASARGLRISHEYLAHGLPDAGAIANALIAAEQGGRLLSAEALFCGLGLYQGATGSNGDIYAVAELSEGEGFMLGARFRRVDNPNLTIKGYAAPAAPLTVYELNEQGQYLSRRSFTLAVDGGGYFSCQLELWQKGRFALVLGHDTVMLVYE